MKREQRKARAIKALSITNSLTEAAQIAGVTRRTLYNYLHDPGFIMELEQGFNASLIEHLYDMEEQKQKAEDTLTELLDDPSPHVRLRAAKIVTDNAHRRECTMIKIFMRYYEAAREENDNFFSYFSKLF